MTVVIAAENYPGAPVTGDVITGADADGVLHAGTRLGPGRHRRLRRRTGAVGDGHRPRPGPGPARRIRAGGRDHAARFAPRTDIAAAAVDGLIAVPS